ncbi:MurR/RpiR family transcriptional regulator [bacterium]|nr:MurR/RpiR family transcriptional regulator [bacterium]
MEKEKLRDRNELIAPVVIDRIRKMLNKFTKRQRVMAEYVLQHPEKVGYLPITDLAKAVGVSVATVVRFCNRLGYSGYIELGREVQNSIQNELSILGRFNLSRSASELSVGISDSAFERIVKLEMESLGNMVQSINKSDFFKCLKWMSKANNVTIVGTMASAALAVYFEYAATKVLPKVKLITSGSGSESDFLKDLSPDSLVFLIAFPRYPQATIDLGTLAKKKKCRIVALTDSHHSPIVQFANLTFLISISVTSTVDAYAAPLTFINTLITEFTIQYPDKIRKNMNAFEEFTKGMKIWHHR